MCVGDGGGGVGGRGCVVYFVSVCVYSVLCLCLFSMLVMHVCVRACASCGVQPCEAARVRSRVFSKCATMSEAATRIRRGRQEGRRNRHVVIYCLCMAMTAALDPGASANGVPRPVMNEH